MASADPAILARSPKWLPLIRYSHIVSSVVREILEADPLVQAGGAGVTPRQLQLLEFIAVAGHRIDDVAKFLRVSPPAATKAVDKLERRGLVARTGCAGDRRVRLLECSPEGLELVTRYRALQQETLAGALGGFADEELSRLAALLERYSRALISAETRGDGLCLRCSGYYDPDCPLQFSQHGCAYAASNRSDR